ncbi:MAG TPA: hypothetical protein VL984_16390 [Acidimicrobiales bacterium]|nr:hypothetical protein [Acidimicrobiales bacterium]
MSGFKESARAGADRLVKPFFVPIESELASARGELTTTLREIVSVREDVTSLVSEIRDRLGAIEADNRATTDEVRGVRGASDIRLDHTNLRLHQILDEAGGLRDRMERLETHFGTVEERFGQLGSHFIVVEQNLHEHFNQLQERFAELAERVELRVGDAEARVGSLVNYFEDQAQRQAELRSAMEDLGEATKQGLEKLELLMMAQLEGLFGSVGSEAAAVRADVVELTRMIRMQGDAADQVAEVMGRAFTRLSAEVEALSDATARLGAQAVTSPA